MADVLGNFEQAVLLAIIRLRDQAYGRAILQQIETRLGAMWRQAPFTRRLSVWKIRDW